MKTLTIGSALTPNLGEIWFALSEAGLAALQFPSSREAFIQSVQTRFGAVPQEDPQKTAPLAAQLQEYAAGQRKTFQTAIDWSAFAPFQRQVLQHTLQIPYGQTQTYGQIAAALGNPRAARAVGRAQATNPMPLVIPCHRVVGANGSLHGYGAGKGLETKQSLLEMEKENA